MVSSVGCWPGGKSLLRVIETRTCLFGGALNVAVIWSIPPDAVTYAFHIGSGVLVYRAVLTWKECGPDESALIWGIATSGVAPRCIPSMSGSLEGSRPPAGAGGIEAAAAACGCAET